MHSSFFAFQIGRHYLAWVSLAFLLGIFYGIYSSALSYWTPLTWGILSLAALITAGVFLVCLKSRIPLGDRVLVFLLVLGFILGIFRVYLFDLWEFRDLDAGVDQIHTYTGVVLDTPSKSSTGKTLGCTVRLCQRDGDAVYGKVKVYALQIDHTIAQGSVVQFTAALSPPAGAPFPGGFNNRHFLYCQGLRYTVMVDTLSPSHKEIAPAGLSYRLESLGRTVRESVCSVIDRSFGAYTEESALLKGLLLGNREGFTAEQTEKYIDSGFVHITAASGMHAMFLFGFLNFLANRLRLPRWLLRCFALPVLLVFASAASFTPSICRAVMMLSLTLIAVQLQRDPDNLTAIAVSALVLTLWNPYCITGYSFILSFAATLGIIFFGTPISQWLTRALPVSPKAPRLFRKLCRQSIGSVSLSLAGSVGIGFFSARFFHRFSWGGILGNILLIPLASFSFMGGILLWMLGSIFPDLGCLLAQSLLRFPLWAMNCLADFFSFSLFRIPLPTPHPLGMLLYLLAGLLFYLWLKSSLKTP